MKTLFIGGALAIMCSSLWAQTPQDLSIPPFKEEPPRVAQFPLKTDRLIHTDAEIEIARQNIDSFASARKIADQIIRSADYWIDWDDQAIINLMASAQVPRAFDLNATGCPIHGAEVFKKGGAYPWIIDPKHPFQVKCPVGGEVYPKNDYEAYYQSGFTAQPADHGEYVDNGWGWVAPNGERYWFVAHANHWIWHRHIIPGIQNLARAYQLTGNALYAHKATLMLHRLAEVYPSMNHEDQSRYGMMMKARHSVYRGKIVNAIWETFIVLAGAESYDAIWDSIDKNTDLQQYLGKTGEEIRSYIEANFLEEALRAFQENKVLGNFGMHQSAILATSLARQYADLDTYIHLLLEDPGTVRSKMGVYYALYNQVFRDGLPLESLQYNSLWINYLSVMANLLRKQGVDLYDLPKFKRILDAPIQSVAIGRYTPAIGDGSDVLGSITGQSVETYQSAYAALGDSTYIMWLNRPKETYFTTYESLFRNAAGSTQPATDGRLLPPRKSRLFAGYGLGILNDTADETALAIKYGMHYSHYHWDFLNVELFANGQKMMPDLGYPDAMNNYVRGIYTWSQNTVSHNTVVVDKIRQNRNHPGVLHHFSESDFTQSIDVESFPYRHIHQYRRNLVLVKAEDGQSYVVDFFHIQGGKQHDYSLHGPPGEHTLTRGVWSAIQPGTLAGPEVPLGQIYDNASLEQHGDSLGYGGYGGSGFQHLFNVQRLEQGAPLVDFKHLRDSSAQLRLHVLPATGQQVYVADAYDKPRAKNHILTYLIARRETADSLPLNSTFVGVFEPFKEHPYIQQVSAVPVNSGEGTAIAVARGNNLDIIIRDTANTLKTLDRYGIRTDANTAVVTLDSQGDVQRVYYTDGTFLAVDGKTFARQPVRGIVKTVDPKRNEVVVELTSGQPATTKKSFSGIFHLTNPYHTTVHPATATPESDNQLRLRLHDDVLVGYFGVAEASENQVTSETELNFYHHYRGTTLLDSTYNRIGHVTRAEPKKVTIDQVPPKVLSKGNKVWLANCWEGDQVMFKTVFSWSKNDD